TFEEPSRPGLFYHLVQTHTRPVFAVSLLETAPKSINSATVIGLLPAPTEDELGTESDATLEDFKPNPVFRELLFKSVKDGLARGVDDGLATLAKTVRDGWLHVNDERNEAAKTGDRIGSPDDIVGSVCVKEGKIIPDTFEPMPSYRLCTPDGVVRLSDPLMAYLIERLK
ncbi:hypothetical protein EXIGLDRAFT_570852, partial [Exidia glandulosa HHB12029]